MKYIIVIVIETFLTILYSYELYHIFYLHNKAYVFLTEVLIIIQKVFNFCFILQYDKINEK